MDIRDCDISIDSKCIASGSFESIDLDDDCIDAPRQVAPPPSPHLPMVFPLEDLPMDMIELIIGQCSNLKGSSALRRSCRQFKTHYDSQVKRIAYRPSPDTIQSAPDIESLARIVTKAWSLEALEIDTPIAPSPNFNLRNIFSLKTFNGRMLGEALKSFKISKSYQLLSQSKDIGEFCPNLKVLELDGACQIGRIFTKDMEAIATGCLYLERLTISGGRFVRLYDPLVLHEPQILPLQHLTYLDISDSHIEDISPLSCATKLKHLMLGKCREIRSIAAIANCLELETLDLHQNLLIDIGPLALMTRLSHLNLSFVRVESQDLSPLTPLVELEELNIKGMVPQPTAPLTCITGAKRLKVLSLGHSSEPFTLETIFSPSSLIEGCLSLLHELDLSFSNFHELSPIISLELSSLIKFKMTNNFCIEKLNGSCSWPSLKFVDLSHCKILSDISAFTNCRKIEECDLSGTNVSSVAPLANCCPKVLNFSCCYSLTDLQVLDGTNLTSVRLRRCYYLDSIAFLAKAHSLRELNISDTAVEDLSPLKGSSLEVLYASSCRRIKDLSPLASLASLETLDLSECHSLTSIEPLGSEHLASLQKLYLRNSFRINDVSPLARCIVLNYVDIGYIKLDKHGAQVIKTLSQKKVCCITYPSQRDQGKETLKTFIVGCFREMRSLFLRRA